MNLKEFKNRKRESEGKFRELIFKKKEGSAELVVAVVMIIIALVLAFMFKDKISAFMGTAFTNLDSKLTTLLGTI